MTRRGFFVWCAALPTLRVLPVRPPAVTLPPWFSASGINRATYVFWRNKGLARMRTELNVAHRELFK